jgi:hypothetical protein
MNWLYNLWYGYLIPSLYGNGPEAIAQTIVYGLIALAIIPPFRHWAERHVESIKQHVTAEHNRLHAKLDHHEELLQHVIKHSPKIPEFPEKP